MKNRANMEEKSSYSGRPRGYSCRGGFSPGIIVKYSPLPEGDLVAYNKEIEFCLNPREIGGAGEGEHFRKI